MLSGARGLARARLRYFLHLSGTDRHRTYRALFERRDQVAGEVDGTIVWHKGASEIRLARDEAISLTAPDAELETARQWMADSLLAFREALHTHLNQVIGTEDAEGLG